LRKSLSRRFILLLRNFELFAQYNRFPRGSDTDFCALRRDGQDLDLYIVANQQ